MRISVEDAAKILKVPAETVYGWIKQGVIPVYRVSDQYKFNRVELLTWASTRHMAVSPEAFLDAEEAGQPPSLLDSLRAGGVLYGVEGDDKPSVLRAMIGALRFPEDEEVDREFLFQVLLARETLGSTCVGGGVAIPHVRNPVVLSVSTPSVWLCFLKHPIDFGALDGQPVNILFTLISTTIRTHLHLLSRLAFALRDEEFRAALKRQAPREELLAAVARIETALPGGENDGGGRGR